MSESFVSSVRILWSAYSGAMDTNRFAASLPEPPAHVSLGAAEVPVAWSVDVVDLGTGLPLLRHEPDRVLGTASVGKVFLLLEVATRSIDGRIDPASWLPIRPAHEVADSGLLHLFRDRTITVADACLLVGAVSDNLATNALTGLCGLDAVRAVSEQLGFVDTAFLDVIRDERTGAHPWAPSCGTAKELSQLFAMLHAGDAVSEEVSSRVLAHLSAGVDTSMVAGGLHLDPLAHGDADGGVLLSHKTGHDSGVRVDAGIVTGPAGGVAYAVGANWSPDADIGPSGVRIVVETHMRGIGGAIRRHVLGG